MNTAATKASSNLPAFLFAQFMKEKKTA